MEQILLLHHVVEPYDWGWLEYPPLVLLGKGVALASAAVLAGFAKYWFDNRKTKREQDETLER